MEIQYKHLPGIRRTLAVVPPHEDVLDSLAASALAGEIPIVTIDVGVAKVHHNDQYCKATGREWAKTNLKREQFTLLAFSVDSYGVRYHFHRKHLDFWMYRAHNKPHAQLSSVQNID
jgi:hypothetical protein